MQVRKREKISEGKLRRKKSNKTLVSESKSYGEEEEIKRKRRINREEETKKSP